MNSATAPTLEWIQLSLQIAVVIIGPIFGWLLKTVFSRLQKLEDADLALSKEVHSIAVLLPTNYVTKPDHDRALNEIFNALRRIEDKLDGKVDK